jgi:polar amino acid transport system permease protein
LAGVQATVLLTLGGAVVAVVCALAAGLGRLSRRAAVRAVATGYVEVFRGTSALVQLFWFYFALPFVGIRLDAITAGIVVLGLNIGSYGAEVVRGAIQAVPPGQREAGVALGFTPRQIRWRIVVPQAAVAMMPPAGNLLIELLKASALASLITVHELTFQGQLLRDATLRTLEIYAVVLLMYYALARLITWGMGRLERRLARGRDAATA